MSTPADREPLPSDQETNIAAPKPAPLPSDQETNIRPVHAHATPTAERAGTTTPTAIGRFAVRGVLGEGGFGTVYLAHDPVMDREVAVKVARSHWLDSPEAVERFRREARHAAQLRHPHICPILEAGEADGRFYLAAAFIPGRSLRDVLDDHPEGLPPPEAAALVRKLAGALAYAHRSGIVHRDVKPDNVIVDPQGDPHLLDFGVAARLDDVNRQTRDGQAIGTAAYMAPEQAAGKVREVGPAADQYALGVLLFETLTGRLPFDNPNVVVMAALLATQEPPSPRKLKPDVPRDLDAVCLKCREREVGKRYTDSDALADDLQRWQDGRPTQARPLSAGERMVRWAKRNPTLAGLSGAVAALVLLVIGGSFAFLNQQLHAAAERERARVEAVVDGLKDVDTPAVPHIVAWLATVRAVAEPMLQVRFAAAAPGSKEQLHLALALLPSDPTQAALLHERLLTTEPNEVAAIVTALAGLGGSDADTLWKISIDPTQPAGRRLRVEAVLAAVAPTDARWAQHARGTAHRLSRLNPLELPAFARVLAPVRGELVPALQQRYHDARAKLKSGTLALNELVAEATALDVTAGVLARYAADQPERLAELCMTVEPRHHALLFPALAKHRAVAVTRLRAELTQSLAWRPAVARFGVGAAPGGVLSAAMLGFDVVPVDVEYDALAKRQANAAATLAKLDEPEAVWPLLQHTPDPTRRSYLIHALAPLGVDVRTLLDRYATETDVCTKRALLLALGEYDPEALPSEPQTALTARLLQEYRDHPDAGLHGAIDWLLRRRWGQAKELDRITAELAVAGKGQPPSAAAGGRDWYVNSQGQTYTVIRGPVEFVQGSPPSEPDRDAILEGQVPRRIGRSFLMAAREVTVSEYLKFNPKHSYRVKYNPGRDTPINHVNWYEAAAYCNWLSEQEGIVPAQWCYEPVGGKYMAGMRLAKDYLSRRGYRLPSEAEWEYAARAGAAPARPYGRGEELLGQYAYYLPNSRERMWPVGSRKPNDLGLFDMLGNAVEWVNDELNTPKYGAGEDGESNIVLSDERVRVFRGGSFYDCESTFVRSAYRGASRPYYSDHVVGFRPARTYD